MSDTAGDTVGEQLQTGIQDPLQTRIRNLVSEQLGLDIAKLTPSAKILDDLGADSLDVVELVMALEEEFDIEIPDEDAEMMNTIGEVESYMAKRVAA